MNGKAPGEGTPGEGDHPATALPRVVVMGVSGSGKSTVGPLVAEKLGVGFADADAFHSPANVAKMHAGRPLTDADRMPWLDAVGAWLAAAPAGGVVACSALRRLYRDRLRAACPGIVFVHLDGSPELIAARQSARLGHFMPASLLPSQFATLEGAGPGERIVRLDVSHTPEALAAEAFEALKPFLAER